MLGSLLGLGKIVDLRSLFFILAFVGLLFGSFQTGRLVEKSSQSTRENIRIINTSRNISEGRNEFQQANPDRDASISLERLRQRQLGKP